MTTAALALLMTTAHADDALTLSKGTARLSLYDRFCEKVPGSKGLIEGVLAEVPARIMRDGQAAVIKEFEAIETIKWCALYKPNIDRMTRQIEGEKL
jgi:hypothetical protein